MKNIKNLLVLFIAFAAIFSQSAMAKTVKVKALTPFNSTKPPYSFEVKVLKTTTLVDNFSVESGSILRGYIYKTLPPKRLKQSASFIFIPQVYITKSGKQQHITNMVAQYTTKINKKDVIVNSAYVFGTIPIVIATAGIFAYQGAKNAQPGEDTVKSSAINVYENSPLSLIEKGNNLNIEKNQNFLLNIVILKQDEPNYEYRTVK